MDKYRATSVKVFQPVLYRFNEARGIFLLSDSLSDSNAGSKALSGAMSFSSFFVLNC